MRVNLVVYPAAAVPAVLAEQVRALRQAAWPGPDSGGPDPALSPVTMLLLDGERVLATLNVLSKPIPHAGRVYRASGLSAVVTDPASRGQGHGHRLVSAAHAHIAGSGVDVGLFTCDSPLRTFYERAGWHWLPGTVLIGGTPEAPLASDSPGFDKVTMGDAFADDVRLESFMDTTVALYPGERDRLW